MERETLAQIEEALVVIYDSKSTNESRKCAQEFLERLKEDSRSPVFGHLLNSPSYQFQSQKLQQQQQMVVSVDTLRFFGLGLLEHSVRFRWIDAFTDSDRMQIKQFIIDISHQYASQKQQQQFIVEKCVRVCAELAEREWPQRWSDFDSQFLRNDLCLASPRGRLMAVGVLKMVAEDVFLYPNPITSKRKEDLRSSLIAILLPHGLDPAITPELYTQCGVMPGNRGWIADIIQMIQQEVVSSATGGPGVAPLCLYVEALNSFIDWIPHQVLVDCQLVSSLLQLLSHPDRSVRNCACDAVGTAIHRIFSDWSQAEQTVIQPLLLPQSMQTVAQVWNALNNHLKQSDGGDDLDEHLDEDYPFLKNLAMIYCDLGASHVMSKKSTRVVDGFDSYLQLLMEFFQHPSLTISSMSAQVLIQMLRSDLAGERTQSAVPQLLVAAIKRLNKKPFIPHGEDVSSSSSPSAAVGDEICGRYSQTDFGDSPADFQVAFGGYRNQLYTLIRICVNHQPLYAFQQCHEYLKLIVNTPPPPLIQLQPQQSTASERNSKGLLSGNSPYYLLWDAFNGLIHSTVSSILELTQQNLKPEEAQEIYKLMMEMAGVLLPLQIGDPLIIARQLECLTAFSTMLKEEPGSADFALALLQKLIGQFITFTLPGEPTTVGDESEWTLSEDSIALRRKACSSLLRIATSVPNVLMSIYAPLVAEIKRLAEAQLISMQERASLYEFRVSIVLHASLTGAFTNDVRRSMFDELYRECCQEILGSGVAQIVQDPATFVQSIGVTALAQLQQLKQGSQQLSEQLRDAKRNRARLQFVVTLYRGCLVRSVRLSIDDEQRRATVIEASPWASQIGSSLSLFLQLAHCLHSLWESEKSLPASLLSILDITLMERNLILGGSNTSGDSATEDSAISQAGTDEQQLQVNSIRNWLRYFRENLYALLGQLTYLGTVFYSLPSLSTQILQHIFSSVTSMRKHHWRSLFHFFIKPLILNCPSDEAAMHAVLFPILPPLLSFIGQKLDAEWKEVIKSNNFLLLANEDGENTGGDQDNQMLTGSSSAAATGGSKVAPVDESEITQLRLLRDLTRVWNDLLVSIFVIGKDPAERKGKGNAKFAASNRPAPDFGKSTSLVTFLLSNKPIVEPLLYGLIASLQWKDTRVCTGSSRILTRILPVLVVQGAAATANYHSFLSQDLLAASLHALHDGYHQEGHDFLIILITDIYCLLQPYYFNQQQQHQQQQQQKQNNTLIQTLITVVGKPNMDVEQFDRRIMQQNAVSEQRKVVKEFLADFIGVKPGQWYTRPETSSKLISRGLPEKMLLKSMKSLHNEQHSALDSGHGMGLLELFS